MIVCPLKSLRYIKGLNDTEESNLLLSVLPVNSLFQLCLWICSIISETFEVYTHRHELSTLRLFAKVLGRTPVFLDKDKLNHFTTDCLLQHVFKALVLVIAIQVDVMDSLFQLYNILQKKDWRTTIGSVVEQFCQVTISGHLQGSNFNKRDIVFHNTILLMELCLVKIMGVRYYCPTLFISHSI